MSAEMNTAAAKLALDRLLTEHCKSVTVFMSKNEKISVTRRANGFKRGQFHEVLLCYGPLTPRQRRKFQKGEIINVVY